MFSVSYKICEVRMYLTSHCRNNFTHIFYGEYRYVYSNPEFCYFIFKHYIEYNAFYGELQREYHSFNLHVLVGVSENFND